MTEELRSMQDRRSGKDRRKLQLVKQLFARDTHHRNLEPRRSTDERRQGWVRLTKWSSVDLERFKISKYLKPY
ncbi:MAG: hypothetical protein M0036_09265 [Desulfobacteraceae bacterium]|nr:hypothetical protein [Desulfobacteraceae bacterium]